MLTAKERKKTRNLFHMFIFRSFINSYGFCHIHQRERKRKKDRHAIRVRDKIERKKNENDGRKE